MSNTSSSQLVDAAGPPLCVDLDGTLLKTDILYESFLLLLKRRCFDIPRAPFWLLRGKAFFKRALAERVMPEVASLPYREELLAHLRQERERGRSLVLATASDAHVAQAVANHIGLFDAVVASDGETNLSGARKLSRLAQRFDGFAYAGNSRADLPIWRQASEAIVAGASPRLAARVRRLVPATTTFLDRPRRLKTLARAIRVHHWLKNVLVFVPLLAAHRIFDIPLLVRAIGAFIAFGLCASSSYLLNDMLDLESDRAHPVKRSRPLAAGNFSVRAALFCMPALLGAGLLLGSALSTAVAQLLLLHFVVTLMYSYRFKQTAILDVLFLAGLYTLRIFTGAAAVGVPVSPWLLALSMFLFLSLAFVKRASELQALRKRGGAEAPGRGYLAGDLELVLNLGSASGYMSVLVLALYIHNPEVTHLYHRPDWLWLLCPLLFYWVSRIWLLANRGEVDADPLLSAVRDPASYAVGGLGLCVGLLAR
ncbi:MAG: Prenyltransferase, UbiA family [bacterium]|nr:Prenyltransferase, UbiA family [bacterium]